MLDGRVAIVTGSGRGLGRAHALELARQGAHVVVNDRGGEVDGVGASSAPAEHVMEEIRALGREAVADGEDVADWDGAGRLVQRALDTFGRLDVLVTNAGIIRDRVLVNMTEDEWDAVIRVHLKGTFCPSRWAAAHWRERAKAGDAPDARIITVTSAAGLYGNMGQTNYASAKAGIVGFATTGALELERYGVTVNAVAPAGRTRMTEQVFSQIPVPDGFDPLDADNVAPFVAWLASAESARVTGRVFEVVGGKVTVAEGWRRGPSFTGRGRLDPTTIGPQVMKLLTDAAPVTRAAG
jgi:NAD(P)-dependent dehydrogenase (short-subunit alcohol dehydrogenase family)